MESDRFMPGYLIYSEQYALMTSNGTKSQLVAGNVRTSGYVEGVGAEARFSYIIFTQMSTNILVVAYYWNNGLRLIDRTTHATSVLSGQCKSGGYKDGYPGLFKSTESVRIDNQNVSQLLVPDHYNSALRTVDINSGVAGTFVKSDSLKYIQRVAQDENGNIYATAHRSAIFLISYREKRVTLPVGAQGDVHHRDSTLLNSLFYNPQNLFFIAPGILLIADGFNDKIRLVEINSNQVSTLKLKNQGKLETISSAVMTKDSLFVGYYKKIIRYRCEFTVIYLNLLLGRGRQFCASFIQLYDSSYFKWLCIVNYKPAEVNSLVAKQNLRHAQDIQLMINVFELNMVKFIIYILDNYMTRRLHFRSRYAVLCSLLDDPVVSSEISSSASRRADVLKQVCGRGTVPRCVTTAVFFHLIFLTC